jgi:hypothetical protein
MFIHLMRELILPLMEAVRNQLAHELMRLGVHMTPCGIQSVSDPQHPNRLVRLVCYVRSVPGMAHPLTGR